jgi:hypothetical protein
MTVARITERLACDLAMSIPIRRRTRRRGSRVLSTQALNWRIAR